MKKYVTLDQRGGKVLVSAQAELESGAHLGHGTIQVVAEDDAQGIGDAVLRALDAYRTGVPMPPRESYEARERELHLAAGVRSRREFMNGARMLDICWEDGTITLTPWRNAGARDGFLPLKGRDRVIVDTSLELGAAVIEALAETE